MPCIQHCILLLLSLPACTEIQIAKACYGSPLALELVGGSLRKERLNVWRQKKKKLSKGHPIVESHTEMLAIFKKYLDDGLEDKPIIKECFMDLSLFPEDQKIPVSALIDIWTEQQHKLGGDLEQRQNLKEADAVNIVYDLTDRHLANLVVRYKCVIKIRVHFRCWVFSNQYIFTVEIIIRYR